MKRYVLWYRLMGEKREEEGGEEEAKQGEEEEQSLMGTGVPLISPGQELPPYQLWKRVRTKL